MDLNQEKERARKQFRNHKAAIVQQDENFLVLDWKNASGDGSYFVRYILDIQRGVFIVEGDLGCSVASWHMEEKMLRVLDIIMQQYVSPYAYSIDVRREDNLCLVQDGGKWIVTIFERGRDEIRYTSPNLFDACTVFIRNAVGSAAAEEACRQFREVLSQ